MFRGIVIAAQSPQGLSRCADAQRFLFVAISVVLTHNVFKKEIKRLFLLKSPQGLSRCADAQRFFKEFSCHKRDK